MRAFWPPQAAAENEFDENGSNHLGEARSATAAENGVFR